MGFNLLWLFINPNKSFFFFKCACLVIKISFRKWTNFNFFFGNIFGEIENAHSLVFTDIFNAKNAVKAKKKNGSMNPIVNMQLVKEHE